MRFGFDEEEYCRVRNWLIAAMEPDPTVITEDTLLQKLRSDEWVLITTENAACVLELCVIDDEKVANVLLLGGERNKSLKEIMRAHLVVCAGLRKMGFTKIVGSPRREFHGVLMKNGFQKGQQEELFKEL